MENMTNVPQEIQDKAARLSAIKGSRFTIEQNIEMLMAEAAKKAKKQSSKKDAAKWVQRSNVDSLPPMTGEQKDAFDEKQRISQYRAAGLID